MTSLIPKVSSTPHPLWADCVNVVCHCRGKPSDSARIDANARVELALHDLWIRQSVTSSVSFMHIPRRWLSPRSASAPPGHGHKLVPSRRPTGVIATASVPPLFQTGTSGQDNIASTNSTARAARPIFFLKSPALVVCTAPLHLSWPNAASKNCTRRNHNRT